MHNERTVNANILFINSIWKRYHFGDFMWCTILFDILFYFILGMLFVDANLMCINIHTHKQVNKYTDTHSNRTNLESGSLVKSEWKEYQHYNTLFWDKWEFMIGMSVWNL